MARAAVWEERAKGPLADERFGSLRWPLGLETRPLRETMLDIGGAMEKKNCHFDVSILINTQKKVKLCSSESASQPQEADIRPTAGGLIK